MNVLLTGGAGYIGTHIALELIEKGHSVVVIDNLSNSSKEALQRVEEMTHAVIPLYAGDVTDKAALRALFKEQTIDAVIHLAGFKAVGESVADPLRYYRNNIDSSLSLCEVMSEFGIKKLIFSSSATVYGIPEILPLPETAIIGSSITNPYGQTKFMVEQILQDLSIADPTLDITILRYFNPAGAHESGRIGEDPNSIPNNILPYISQVAVGKLEKVSIFGDDYDTVDGTGVRDYIHVVDLAKGHIAALEHTKKGVSVYNLASGTGVSVLQLITAFEKVSGKTISYQIIDRRPGDIDACYASPLKANTELHWSTEKSIEDICADAWRWQSQNPNGYRH